MSSPTHNKQYDHTGKAYSFQNKCVKDLIAGIPSIVRARMQEGWTPHRLSFMFKQLPVDGRLATEWMTADITAFHRNLTNRSLRRANRPAVSHMRPILFAAPDVGGSVSGQRGRKVAGGDTYINDGLHYDAILLMPAKTRVALPLLESSLDRYRPKRSWIARVYCAPLDDRDGAASYALKWAKWHTSYEDSLVFLPDSSKSGLQIQAERERETEVALEQIAFLKKQRLEIPELIQDNQGGCQ